MIGRLRIHYPSVTSTMDVAAALAAAGAPHGTVVTADHQTAGRGRHGRAWADEPRRSLLASWVLRMPVAPEHPGVLSPLLALAVARSVAALAPHAPVAVKWPNDVLVDGRKIAGILLTSRAEGAGLRVIAGTGINVRDSGISGATALDAWTPDATAGRLLDALAHELDAIWPAIGRHGMTDAQHAELEALLAWRGERVSVLGQDGGVEGVVAGLGRDGALLLLTDDVAEPIALHAGEVARGPRTIC